MEAAPTSKLVPNLERVVSQEQRHGILEIAIPGHLSANLMMETEDIMIVYAVEPLAMNRGESGLNPLRIVNPESSHSTKKFRT